MQLVATELGSVGQYDAVDILKLKLILSSSLLTYFNIYDEIEIFNPCHRVKHSLELEYRRC